jgi:hypothetical protein
MLALQEQKPAIARDGMYAGFAGAKASDCQGRSECGVKAYGNIFP